MAIFKISFYKIPKRISSLIYEFYLTFIQPSFSILGNPGLYGCVSHLQVNRYRLDLQKVQHSRQCPRSDATTCGTDYCHGHGRCYKVSTCDQELHFTNRPKMSSDNSNQLVFTVDLPDDTFFHGFELINTDDDISQNSFDEREKNNKRLHFSSELSSEAMPKLG